MMRGKYAKAIHEKKYPVYDFEGVWKAICGTPEQAAFWLVYGQDKNGKTWFSLLLAKYLSKFSKVMYISAEQGIGNSFKDSLKRAGIDILCKDIIFYGYAEITDIEEKLKKRKCPRIVFIDNLSIYQDELRKSDLKRWALKYNKLFVFIAHEDNNKPYTAQASLVQKLAHIIARVQGLKATISGRCPGGDIIINEEKAVLYHGTQILDQ